MKLKVGDYVMVKQLLYQYLDEDRYAICRLDRILDNYVEVTVLYSNTIWYTFKVVIDKDEIIKKLSTKEVAVWLL